MSARVKRARVGGGDISYRIVPLALMARSIHLLVGSCQHAIRVRRISTGWGSCVSYRVVIIIIHNHAMCIHTQKERQGVNGDGRGKKQIASSKRKT